MICRCIWSTAESGQINKGDGWKNASLTFPERSQGGWSSTWYPPAWDTPSLVPRETRPMDRRCRLPWWDWNQRIHWLEDTQSVASLDLNTVGPKDLNLHLDHLMHLTGTASARQAGVWLLQNWSPGNSSLKLRLISDIAWRLGFLLQGPLLWYCWNMLQTLWSLITYLLCALSLGVSDYLHAIPAATHSNMASRDGAQKIPVRHSAKLRWKIRWLQERQAESIFVRLSDLFCYEFALSLMGFREHDGSLKSDYLQD